MRTSKQMTNLEIAELLRSVAAAYQLRDEAKNRFKIIAYERAADAVEHASSELKDLWDEKKLDEVPGIGIAIANHLDEIFQTGKSEHFSELMQDLPQGMFALLEVPGIGAKIAFRLADELKIDSLADLEKACRKGQVAQLPGFGIQSQQDILKSLAEIRGRTRRHLLPYASQIAAEVVEWLKRENRVIRADPLGSLRRQASTVGDIDIAVATNEAKTVIEYFCQYPKAERVLEKGERTASLVVPGGVQIDLMVQEPESYGSLLQHFTGSKHHNIALREYAIKQGLSLSEYGIRSLRKIKNQESKIKKFQDEESFYNFLGLEWIPPELREDAGEIDASRERKLPKLVELEQIKSDLQIHSSFDTETSHDLGNSSMEEIVNKAKMLGYEYLAFTEHNPSRSKHTDKQIVEILKRKREKIEHLNYPGVKKVFNSLELDILPDGRCPIPIQGFDYLDFALVSIHSSFRQSRDKMTQRVLQALAWHPKVKIFAHPTARRLNEREGIEIHWPKVFEFCLKQNKWLEINADPVRLDLPDFLVQEAVKNGVKLTLGTDAHHQDHLANMIYGVAVVRRGWAQKNDIINCLALKEFEEVMIK